MPHNMSSAKNSGPFSRLTDLLLSHGGTLVFLGFFFLYLVTLSPTITEEDSGDFVMAAWFLGAPHPTGYPAFILPARLSTLIPLGDPAFRVNLLSATFGALSCAALFRFFLICLGGGPESGSGPEDGAVLRSAPTGAVAGAMAAAFAFGTSRDVWLQSVITEVYTLANLLNVLLLWSAYAWIDAVKPKCRPVPARGTDRSEAESQETSTEARQGKRSPGRREFLMACLLLGLGMANHHSIALAAVACVACAFASLGFRTLEFIDPLTGASGFGLFALGLMPYLMFPVRTIVGDPSWNWGDPDGLWQLYRMVSRTQYDMTAYVDRDLGVLSGQLWSWVDASLAQWGGVIFFLGLAGLLASAVSWFRSGRGTRSQGAGTTPEGRSDTAAGTAALPETEPAAAVLFVTMLAAFSAGIVGIVSNPLTELHLFGTRVFFIPGYLALAYGIGWITARFADASRGPEMQSPGIGPGRAGRPVAASVALMAVLAALAGAAMANFGVCDGSDNLVAHDFNMNILKSIEEPAALMVSGDAVSFPLHYMTLVSGVSRGIPLVSVPSLSYHWYLPQLKRRLPGFVNFPFRIGYQGAEMMEPYIERAVRSHPELNFHFTSLDSEVAGRWDMVPRGIVYLAKPRGFSKRPGLTGEIAATQGELFSAMRIRLPEFFRRSPLEFRRTRLVAHGLLRNYTYTTYNTGTLLCEGGLHEEALGWFDRALEFVPHHMGSLLNRGYCLRAMGRSREAIVSYEAAAGFESDPACGHEEKPNRRLAWGEPGALPGREEANDRESLVKGRISALQSIAAIHLDQNRPDEAISALKKAVSLDPCDPMPVSNMGAVMMRAGRLNEATGLFLEALRLDPLYSQARDYLMKCRKILEETAKKD